MSDINDTIFDAIRRRSAQRRDVLKYAGQATAVAGGLTMLSACGGDAFDHTIPPVAPYQTPTPAASPTPAPSPAPTGTSSLAVADIPYFQFMLNVEYLRASFFLMTSSNTILPPQLISGDAKFGAQGSVTTTAAANNPLISYTTKDTAAFAPMFATELANNTVARITKMRTLLGASSIAIPAIDIQGARTDGGAWQTAAVGATITKAGTSFNPSNLIASFISASSFLNSAGLAAYRGVMPLLTKAGADTMSGFLGAMSYETALLRAIAVIQGKGALTNAQISNINLFSIFADSLDGPADLDQGPGSTQGLKTAAASNIVARDANGLALARTPQQTLNVLYLTTAAVSLGGFFPNGVNGDASLKTSSAAA